MSRSVQQQQQQHERYLQQQQLQHLPQHQSTAAGAEHLSQAFSSDHSEKTIRDQQHEYHYNKKHRDSNHQRSPQHHRQRYYHHYHHRHNRSNRREEPQQQQQQKPRDYRHHRHSNSHQRHWNNIRPEHQQQQKPQHQMCWNDQPYHRNQDHHSNPINNNSSGDTLDYQEPQDTQKKTTETGFVPASSSSSSSNNDNSMRPKLWKRANCNNNHWHDPTTTTATAIATTTSTTTTTTIVMPDPAEISATDSSFSQASPLVLPPNHPTTTTASSVSSVCSTSATGVAATMPTTTTTTATATTTTLLATSVPQHIRATNMNEVVVVMPRNNGEGESSLAEQEQLAVVVDATLAPSVATMKETKMIAPANAKLASPLEPSSVKEASPAEPTTTASDPQKLLVPSTAVASNNNNSNDETDNVLEEQQQQQQQSNKDDNQSVMPEEDGSTIVPQGKSNDEYAGLPDGNSDLVTVGTRVAVYWGKDECYYEAVVRKERPHKKKKHLLRYDQDGDKEWINFKKATFYILSGGLSVEQEPTAERVDADKHYNNSSNRADELATTDRETEAISTMTLSTKTSENTTTTTEEAANETALAKKRKFDAENSDEDDSIFGDHDDSKPTGKSETDYEGLEPGRVELVEVGTQVAVYWDDDKCYYEATVVKERPEKKKRFLLHYDDGDKEWINLQKVPFYILSGGIETNDQAAPENHRPETSVLNDEKRVNADAQQPGSDATELSAAANGFRNDVASDNVDSLDEKESEPLPAAAESIESMQSSQNQDSAHDDDNDELASDLDEPKANGKAREDYAGLPEGRVDKVRIGTRLAVYWNGDDCYYEAVVKKDRPHKKKRFLLRYDDGDKEWINPNKTQFFVLSGAAEYFNHQDWVNDDDWVAGATTMESSDSEDDEKKEPVSTQVVAEENAKEFAAPLKTDVSGENQGDKPVHNPASTESVRVNETATDEASMWQELYAKFGDVRFSSRSRAAASEQPAIASAPPPKKRRVEADNEKLSKPKESGHAVPKGAGERKRKMSASASLPKSKKKPTVLKLKLKMGNKPVACSPTLLKPCSGINDTVESFSEEARRKKEESRTPTAAEIAAILGEECDGEPCADAMNWVRRSARMPSRSALNSPKVKQLLDFLKTNHPDMVVLKMKKYVPDSATPQLVIDTVLDALEENTNCEALYIQNYNEGMRDEQVLRLLKILQLPSCKIWNLNIGETYKVKHKTWKKFAKGLKKTKITHMYASEHTISAELKDFIRSTIRDNRSKHTMHIDPNNLDTIVKCTHCWWNPINAKVLRPYLQARGYAHILNDKTAQGARGTEESEKHI